MELKQIRSKFPAVDKMILAMTKCCRPKEAPVVQLRKKKEMFKFD